MQYIGFQYTKPLPKSVDKSKVDFVIFLAVIFVMLDSFFTYLLTNIVHIRLPVNVLVLIFVLIVITKRGFRYTFPPTKETVWIILSVLGFLSAVILLPEFGYKRVMQIISAVVAFLVGYVFFRWNDNDDTLAKVLIVVGIAYVSVCMIALLKIDPQHFPVINQLWDNNGVIERRPEVTTDQNFQVFYLLSPVLVLSMPYKLKRTVFSLLLTLGAIFVLVKLQTRSGFLVLSGALIFGLLAPFWTKSLGRGKAIAFVILGFIIVLVSLPVLIQFGELLYIRFFESDYKTGLGRLHGFLYLFEIIYDPTYWIPVGNEDYVKNYGNVPHSNITAVFLDGGILSMLAWFALVAVPLYKLGKLFINRRLDIQSTIVLIGGTAVLIAQLSLNVPLMDQIWLWSGATIGSYYQIVAKNRR